MTRWWQRWSNPFSRSSRATSDLAELSDQLWQANLRQYPFLQRLSAMELACLRHLSQGFLASKEFQGVHGLTVTDEMALSIASQACLPLMHWGPTLKPLDWYDDFVGIVVHPGPAIARREWMDEQGIVHGYDEVLSGEAMEHGPVMLSWSDVAQAGASAEEGYNVVIHEFVHKLDMRDGAPDGCPPLPPSFMGSHSRVQARAQWFAILEPAFEAFRETVIRAERFGQPEPWLDAYGSQSIDEFFAVTCEAYFVNPSRFNADFADLARLYDAFFRPLPEAGASSN